MGGAGNLCRVDGALEPRAEVADDEVVDGVVVYEARALPVARSTPAVVVQAVAVAATSFVAGAATLAVVNRRRSGRRPAAGFARRAKPATGALEVVASRRFIVDVHQLGPR